MTVYVSHYLSSIGEKNITYDGKTFLLRKNIWGFHERWNQSLLFGSHHRKYILRVSVTRHDLVHAEKELKTCNEDGIDIVPIRMLETLELPAARAVWLGEGPRGNARY